MVARPRRPTSHGGCRPESCHEVHKGQDHLQGAHGHRAPPHQVLKGWRNILHPRMGRHHSRLTCASARARTATCSSAASSTKRFAAQAESGSRGRFSDILCTKSVTRCIVNASNAPPRVWSLEHLRWKSVGSWNSRNCTFRANLAHFSRRTVLPPRDYKNITQPDELKYTTIVPLFVPRWYKQWDDSPASIVAFARNCGSWTRKDTGGGV